MAKRRAIIIDGEGVVRLADGKIPNPRVPDRGTPYDLDAARQKGASIFQTYPIGSGTSMLILIDEPDE